jgi:hypothetical protein
MSSWRNHHTVFVTRGAEVLGTHTSNARRWFSAGPRYTASTPWSTQVPLWLGESQVRTFAPTGRDGMPLEVIRAACESFIRRLGRIVVEGARDIECELNLDKTFVQICVGTVRVEAGSGRYNVILRRADGSFRTVWVIHIGDTSSHRSCSVVASSNRGLLCWLSILIVSIETQ